MPPPPAKRLTFRELVERFQSAQPYRRGEPLPPIPEGVEEEQEGGAKKKPVAAKKKPAAAAKKK